MKHTSRLGLVVFIGFLLALIVNAQSDLNCQYVQNVSHIEYVNQLHTVGNFVLGSALSIGPVKDTENMCKGFDITSDLDMDVTIKVEFNHLVEWKGPLVPGIQSVNGKEWGVNHNVRELQLPKKSSIQVNSPTCVPDLSFIDESSINVTVIRPPAVVQRDAVVRVTPECQQCLGVTCKDDGVACLRGQECGSGNCIEHRCSDSNSTCFNRDCGCPLESIQCPAADKCVKIRQLEEGSMPYCRQEECISGYANSSTGHCALVPSVPVPPSPYTPIVYLAIGVFILLVLVIIARQIVQIIHDIGKEEIRRQLRELQKTQQDIKEDTATLQRKRLELEKDEERIADLPLLRLRVEELTRKERGLSNSISSMMSKKASSHRELARLKEERNALHSQIDVIKESLARLDTMQKHVSEEQQQLSAKEEELLKRNEELRASTEKMTVPYLAPFGKGKVWCWRNPERSWYPCYVDKDSNGEYTVKTDNFVHIDIAERHIIEPHKKWFENYFSKEFSAFVRGNKWLGRRGYEVHHIDRDILNMEIRNLAVITKKTHNQVESLIKAKNVPLYNRSEGLKVLRELGVRQPHIDELKGD